MEVLLKEAVVKLGKRGDIVKVAPGYARNFLFPKGFATPVTEGNKRQLAVEKRNYERRQLQVKETCEEVKQKLESMTIEVTKNAADNGQLFGSVTSHEVAKILEDDGIEVERRKLEIPPIKELGEYTAKVRLHVEVSAELKIKVVAQD